MFNAFQMVGIYGLFYYLPIYFQTIYNTSAILSGVYIIPMILPQLLTAGLTGGICKSIARVREIMQSGDRLTNGTLSAEDGLRDPNSYLLTRTLFDRHGPHIDTPGRKLGKEMGWVPNSRGSRLRGWVAASAFLTYTPTGNLC